MSKVKSWTFLIFRLLKSGKKLLKHFSYIRCLKNSDYFDFNYYFQHYKEEIIINPYVHFLYMGGFTEKNPSQAFDTAFYIKANPGVIKQNINPLIHYLMFGKKEGRIPSRNFRRTLNKKQEYFYQVPIRDDTRSIKISSSLSVFLFIDQTVEVKDIENTFDSLHTQWFKDFDIIAFVDGNIDETVLQTMQEKRNRIKMSTQNTKDMIQSIDSEYIACLRIGDKLCDDALYCMVKSAQDTQADIVYSDHDKFDDDINYYDPHNKPDFSYDMFLSSNYIGYFVMMKTKALQAIQNPFDISLKDAMIYDTLLKLFEKTNRIYHIAKVLVHMQIKGEVVKEKNSILQCTHENYKKALDAHFKRKQIKAKILKGDIVGSYRIEYQLDTYPLVSIIIPFKDQPEYLKTCINSILENTDYPNFEVIGIANNSELQETLDMMHMLECMDPRISFYQYNVPFNFSNINNYATKHFAKGEILLFLNNDTKAITKGWLTHMVGVALQDHVGAVSAKLLYDNDTIQSAGIFLNPKKAADEFHKNFDVNDDGYFARLKITQNVSGVSGACLLVERKKFESVSGFDEQNFAVSLNDLDLCLRLLENGYVNIITPYVLFYHFESLSRGTKPKALYSFEKQRIMEIYHDLYLKGDAYYNHFLTLDFSDFSFK